MSTIKETEFDYPAYTSTHRPDVTSMQRGTTARRQRFEAVTKRHTMRIDADILAEFRQLVSEAQDEEKLINQALREWLAAQNVKDLLREELHQMLQIALTPVQSKSRGTVGKRASR
jgi:uncharacterized protein (DUF4415 family)